MVLNLFLSVDGGEAQVSLPEMRIPQVGEFFSVNLIALERCPQAFFKDALAMWRDFTADMEAAIKQLPVDTAGGQISWRVRAIRTILTPLGDPTAFRVDTIIVIYPVLEFKHDTH